MNLTKVENNNNDLIGKKRNYSPNTKKKSNFQDKNDNHSHNNQNLSSKINDKKEKFHSNKNNSTDSDNLKRERSDSPIIKKKPNFSHENVNITQYSNLQLNQDTNSNKFNKEEHPNPFKDENSFENNKNFPQNPGFSYNNFNKNNNVIESDRNKPKKNFSENPLLNKDFISINNTNINYSNNPQKNPQQDRNFNNNNKYPRNFKNENNKKPILLSKPISYRDLEHLPIMQYKDEILNLIKKERVIIISGTTGCGKTTQVPKFIYEEFRNKIHDTNTKILITQPRRIAAVAIARRLSDELQCKLGGLVGYHVGLNPNFSSETKILICTTGIFLQKLINENSLDEYEYIIIDEVHERDVDIDLLLILLKHMLKTDSKVKLILMSATISINLFANFFSQNSINNVKNTDFFKENNIDKDINFQNLHDIWFDPLKKDDQFELQSEIIRKNNQELLPDSAKIVEIKSQIFHVEVFYLEAIIMNLSKKNNHHRLFKDFSNVSFQKNSPSIHLDLYLCAYFIVLSILKGEIGNQADNNSILIFLPGVNEIQTLENLIMENLEKYDPELMQTVKICQLHSNISDEEQQDIFIEYQQRKIIIATNIAESSITIPDAKYVIDFCLVKELRYSVKQGSESLEVCWSSRASCDQRKGRAGRLTNGFAFRLIRQHFYENDLSSHSFPELLRIPLEKTVLRLKVWDQGEPVDILGRAIQPPNIKLINNSIYNLQSYGALSMKTKDSPSGNLTKLGKIYSNLPIEIKYSRLIVLSYAFGLIEPAIIIASIISQEKSIFKIKDAIELYDKKIFYSSKSDCDFIASYNAYIEWFIEFINSIDKQNNGNNSKYQSEQYLERNLCEKLKLNYNVAREVKNLSYEIRKRLSKLGYIKNKDNNQNFNVENLILSDNTGNQDKIFFIKIAFGGAFYGKIMKSFYSNLDSMKKRVLSNTYNLNNNQNNQKKNTDITKTIFINIENHERDESDELNKLLKEKILKNDTDLKITNKYDEYVIEFGEDINVWTYIKKILNIGSNSRFNDRSFSIYSSDFSDPKKFNRNLKNNISRLKRPEYPFEIKLTDVFTGLMIDNEVNSLNHALIEPDKKNLGKTFYVCDNYYNRNFKYYAKIISKLPMFPMIDKIVTLLFTPHAEFIANEAKNAYSAFKTFGCGNEIPFTHTFSSCDVYIINKIRKYINKIINDELDENHYKSYCNIIKKEVQELIHKKRFKIINNNDWWRIFYTVYPDYLKKIEENLNKKFSTSELKTFDEGEEDIFEFDPESETEEKSETEKIKINQDNLENKNLFTYKKNKKISTETNFLCDLIPLDIKEDFRLWNEEDSKDIQKEREKFKEMREKIFKNIDEYKRLFYNDMPTIVCKMCKKQICKLNNLKNLNSNLHQLNGWISPFITEINLEDLNFVSQFVIDLQNFLALNKNIEFQCLIACREEKHIFGFKTKSSEYYVSNFSPVGVILPCGNMMSFTIENLRNDYEKIKENNHLSMKVREGLIRANANCVLCNVNFDKRCSISELEKIRVDHFERNSHHKIMVAELNEEEFD